MNYIIPITGILGIFIGIIFLNKYKFLKRLIIAIGIELLLYLFGFIPIYLVLMLSSFFHHTNNYNVLFAVGTLIALLILSPTYCYYINKYDKNNKYISILITTIIYLVILFGIALFI